MKQLFTLLSVLISGLVLKGQITIQSTIPATLGINTELTFDVKINKGAVANFSKYQMDVPAGITISEVETKTGSFSFENNRAKIVWVTTPTEPEFVVTMKLNSGAGTTPGTINQKFYYLENGTKKEVEAEPINIVFSSTGSSTPARTAATATVNNAVINKETNTSAAKNTIIETTTPIKENKPAEPVVQKAVAVESKIVEKKPVVTENLQAPAATGIVYKVQLAASAEKPMASKYASLQQVNITKEGTMYKVLVGNFASKDEAIKMKTDLAAKGFNGFVVAYQNGERVK